MNLIGELIRFALSKAEMGETVVIPGRGGWEIRLVPRGGEFDLVHCNPAEDGGDKFFRYSTEGNRYGAGMIEQECTLGVSCRSAGVDADGLIVGAIVLDADGKVTGRFSWSNLVHTLKKRFRIRNDGALFVWQPEHGNPLKTFADEELDSPKGYLRALFCADKNLMKGYVGVFGPENPETVKILEMETLLLASV